MSNKTMVQLADGTFAEAKVLTKAQQNELIRAPQVRNALLALFKGDNALTDWFVKNEDEVNNAFDAGTIRRVSKADRKSLAKALNHVADKLAADLDAEFVVKHKQAILDTFKWPDQKRVKPEEKEAVIRTAFLELTGDNEKLVEWILANKDELEVAYATGIVKRAVDPKAQAALAEYRAKVAAAKEAAKEAE